MMIRRSHALGNSARCGMLALLVALSLITASCAKNGSGDESTATSDSSPMAATATPAVATNDLMAKLPIYPGAAHAAAQRPAGGPKQVTSDVYTTRDSFDKVYAWYQSALPAHSESSHETSQNEDLAVFTMSDGSTQQSVSILKTNGVEVTNITLTLIKISK
jgi:hypothetical protein